MPLEPSILLIVYGLHHDPRMKRWILEEFSDRASFENKELESGGEIPIFAANARGTVPFTGPFPNHIHVINRGWLWEIEEPASFPELPLLLTTDPHFRVVFAGEVELRPGEIAQHTLEDGYETIKGEKRYGVLAYSSNRPGRGILTAFSNQIARLPSGILKATFYDSDDHFGDLIVA